MFKDLYSEIKSFINGSTFDAVIPAILFIIANQFLPLSTSLILAISSALLLCVYRIIRKSKWQYSVFGFIGVVVAAGFAYFVGNADGYFLPGIISSGFMFLLCLVSLMFKKPFAAWISHITRGWSREWFWRQDVLPAYYEVTIVWSIFLLTRLVVFIWLYAAGESNLFFVSNLVLGTPMTFGILTFSYVYGIWRLHKLGGPGVDEYEQGIEAPWRGQRKGF